MTQAERRADQMQGRMKKVGASLAGLGAALGAGAIVAGITSIASKALEMGSALTEAAAKVGVTVEALQEMRYVAEQNGVSIETMEGSMNKMTKTLGSLQMGNEKTAETFKALGLSAQQMVGLAPTESFAKIAEALKGIEDDTVRAALGNQVFGRSYAELKPLVDLGAAGIAAAAAEKRKDGVISTEQAKKLDDLADGWARLKEKVGVAAAQFIANRAASGDASAGLDAMGDSIGRLLGDFDKLLSLLNKATIKFHEFQRFLAVRQRDSAVLGGLFPGIKANAQQAINIIDAEVQKKTSNGGGRSGVRGGTGGKRISGARAVGGPVTAGNSYLVGEKGPEIWTAKRSGTIIPNSSGAGISSIKIKSMFDDIIKQMPMMADVVSQEAGEIDSANSRIVKSFEEMANGTLASVGNFARAVKGGGIVSILEGLVGLFMQLGSVGAFGKGIAGKINAPAGARAAGGPVSAGRSYLVGEKGPEIWTAKRSGSIIPNHAIGQGGGSSVRIVPSKYFDAIVEQISGNVAAPMAARAAVAGSQIAQQQMGKSRKNRIP